MDKIKRDAQKSKASKEPRVTIRFAETEDHTLIDTVLGMLLQSFSRGAVLESLIRPSAVFPSGENLES